MITTIKIDDKTRDILKKSRIYKRETYDEIILRLINNKGVEELE